MSKGNQTRANILGKTARIASAVGLQGLTIGSIAKAVGMSKSGLFAHFSSKENLQLMVLKFAIEDFMQKVFNPAIKQPRGEPRIMALFNNWIAYLDDGASTHGGSILIAAALEFDDRPGPLRDYVHTAQKGLLEKISRAARIAIDEKHFGADLDVEQFAWNIYSIIIGYHHFRKILDHDKGQSFMRRAYDNVLTQARRTSNGTV